MFGRVSRKSFASSPASGSHEKANSGKPWSITIAGPQPWVSTSSFTPPASTLASEGEASHAEPPAPVDEDVTLDVAPFWAVPVCTSGGDDRVNVWSLPTLVPDALFASRR